jgi:hypothetical protein
MNSAYWPKFDDLKNIFNKPHSLSWIGSSMQVPYAGFYSLSLSRFHIIHSICVHFLFICKENKSKQVPLKNVNRDNLLQI